MRVVQTELAPAAIGTYSQAIGMGNTVYLSGQIPLDPATMVIISEDIREQINQVFLNLSAVCEAAGGNLSQLVKVTVYLIDLAHFPLVNEAMTRFFQAPYPARAVIGVAALPRQALVEVDGVMIVDNCQ